MCDLREYPVVLDDYDDWLDDDWFLEFNDDDFDDDFFENVGE